MLTYILRFSGSLAGLANNDQGAISRVKESKHKLCRLLRPPFASNRIVEMGAKKRIVSIRSLLQLLHQGEFYNLVAIRIFREIKLMLLL
jgi:hypothetical protein